MGQGGIVAEAACSCNAPHLRVGFAMAAPRFVIIGNPENRRVTMFQEELAERSLPPAIEIAYRDMLDNPEVLDDLPDQPLWIRQESAGEDAQVHRQLLDRGFAQARAMGAASASPDELDRNPIRHGEIRCPRQVHLGFLTMLEDIEARAKQNSNWRLLSPTASVAELFDKRETSKRWRSMGIGTPECLDDVTSFDDLRERALAKGWRSVFVKVSCASSASGLAIYRPGDTDSIMTTIEHTRDGWYNSLKLRRYNGSRVREILEMLIGEGAQVEGTAPKARLSGAHFDLRVVAIAGKPVFTVIRQSRHPITNLHLGGWRGDWQELLEKLSAESLSRIDASCARVAEATGCHSVGIDVLVEPDWQTHRIIEANAFGDLLPRLKRRGLTVYGWQIDSLLRAWRGAT
tara:strand:- start:13835 stop:15043 length:1209 start_codon:yes stop_codon:yes gene_type:complete